MALHIEPSAVSMEMVIPRKELRPFAPIARPDDSLASDLYSIQTTKAQFHTKQALWRLLSQYVATFPAGKVSLFDKLGNLCALLGAICIALVFFLGRGLILLDTFGSVSVSKQVRLRAANFAGLAGAVAFATSIPFWLASTRCTPYPFEVLLLLLANVVLLRVVVKRSAFPLFIFGILLSLNIFEWQVGLFMAPLFLLLAIHSKRIGHINNAFGTALMLIGILIGMLLYFIACRFAFGGQDVTTSLVLRELHDSIKYGGTLLFGGIFESPTLLSSFCLALLPYLALIAMLIWHGNGTLVCYFALTGIFAACSLNASFSPWGASRIENSRTLPVFSYLLNSALGVYLVGKSALLAHDRFLVSPAAPLKPGEKTNSSSCRLLLWTLIAFIVWNAFGNFNEMPHKSDCFLDGIATEVACDLKDQTLVLMRENELDSLLRIHAYLNGKRIVVCDPFGDRMQPLFRAAINKESHFFRNLPKDRINAIDDTLSTTNISIFIQEWIAIDPKISSKLLVMHPDTITQTGKEAIPLLIGYYACDGKSQPDWLSVADRHLHFWEKLLESDIIYPDAPRWLRDCHLDARRQIVAEGKYLVEKLSEKGHHEKAAEALTIIQSFEKDTAPLSTPSARLFF